ncbi:Uncharacterised protein (plasmid) [Mycoplasmopsis canis]|uniref:Uncharacterized protein n=1 Tax=Mycoplasmopsis canis TaxID=29555 RepID=A0A449ARW1_9BACT|nr:Uncharacterised protein [Mycoplasmopsis canis]
MVFEFSLFFNKPKTSPNLPYVIYSFDSWPEIYPELISFLKGLNLMNLKYSGSFVSEPALSILEANSLILKSWPLFYWNNVK